MTPFEELRESMTWDEWRHMVKRFVDAPKYCLGVMSDGSICMNESVRDSLRDTALVVPLCQYHFELAVDRMHRWFEEDSQRVYAKERHEIEMGKAQLAHQIAIGGLKGACVYYIQRQDGLIKIGYSGNFAARLNSLTKEHGPLVVLATEAGDYDQEKFRHRQFAKFRVEGEWFKPSAKLRRLISTLELAA